MIGTLKINAWMGFVAFIFTFITAFIGNIWSVSLERAVVAFLMFFIGAFPVRWLLYMATVPINQKGEGTDKGELGQNIDLVTDLDKAEASENEPTETFTPLAPPRIERNVVEQDPSDIANMIRRLTDE